MIAPILPLLFLAGTDPASLGPVPAGTVRVYLVRHAEAFSNLTPPPPNVSEKQMDALTAKGRQQGEAVEAALRSIDLAAILHSPTGRTQETAQAIRGARQVPLREEKDLRRIENGKSQSGKPLELADRVAIWKAGTDPRPAGGESMVDLGLRIHGLLLSLRKAHAGKGVACVTHAEPIGALLGHLHGTPGATRYPPGIPLASITVLDVTASGEVKELLAKFEPPARPAPAK